ncbi:hypothetical protein TrispH2_011718, partial [Trichoplax sp. H2]
AIIPPKNTNTPSAIRSPSIKRSTSSENSGNTLLEVDEFGNKAYDAIIPPKNTNTPAAIQSPSINTNLVDHNHPIKTKECNPNDCKFTIAVKAIRIGIRKWPSDIPITISSEKITITIEDLKYPVDIPNEDIIECKAALDLPYLIMRTSQKIAKEINEKLLLCDDQQDSWLYDPVSTASYKKYIWIESQSSHDFNKVVKALGLKYVKVEGKSYLLQKLQELSSPNYIVNDVLSVAKPNKRLFEQNTSSTASANCKKSVFTCTIQVGSYEAISLRYILFEKNAITLESWNPDFRGVSMTRSSVKFKVFSQEITDCQTYKPRGIFFITTTSCVAHRISARLDISRYNKKFDPGSL